MLALQKGDKAQVQTILRQFKTPTGAANFPVLLGVPTDQRLAKMAENDFEGTLGVVTAGVTLAMESLNLRMPMNAIQILDLSEAIIDTAHEDNLALEDLMLFLQNLTRGKYNPLYESMDVPKFMEKFELYRQERHRALLEIKENEHLQLKGLGNSEKTGVADPLEQHFSKMANQLSDLRNTVKELRNENR